MADASSSSSCPRCGSPLSSSAAGLCPRCLMAMNLRTQTMPTGESVPVEPPPTPEDLREKFPQFEILECLGRGGMGIVYRARQKALDRVVALKILAGEWQDEAGFAGRFEKEAKLLARLNHPNIVTIHDFGRAGDLYYIVMEYVDGVNVRDLLRDGRLESEQALAIVPPICDALQFAHDHGVVHRDIKPENILLDREGRVKIADFGIATMAGDAADRSGTPAYMAPEQAAHAQAVDHRADIYALGVVLHEMLTGERPAAGAVPSGRVQIDVRLDEIVLRSLAAKPELRFQQVSEVKSLVTQVMLTPPPAMPVEAEAGAGAGAGAGVEADVAVKPERVKVKLRLVPWRMFLKAGAGVLLVAAVFRLWAQSYLYAADVPHIVAAGAYLSGDLLPLACFTVLAWLGYRRHVREHGGDERPWWQRKAAAAAGLCMALGTLLIALCYFARVTELMPYRPGIRIGMTVMLAMWLAGILLGLRARKSFEGRWALSAVLLLVMMALVRTGIDALRYEWYPPYRAMKTRLHEEKAASQMVGQPGVKLAIDLESGAAITYTWAPESFERRMEEWGADLYFDGSNWNTVDLKVAEGSGKKFVQIRPEDLDLVTWQLRPGIGSFGRARGIWAFQTRDGVRGVLDMQEDYYPKMVQYRVLDYGKRSAAKDEKAKVQVEAESPQGLAERLLEKSMESRVPDLVRIRIAPDGSVTVNRQEREGRGLLEELKRLSAEGPGRPVMIEAGSEVKYSAVTAVLDLCTQAGLTNASFYTETTPEVIEGSDVPLPAWKDEGAEEILPKVGVVPRILRIGLFADGGVELKGERMDLDDLQLKIGDYPGGKRGPAIEIALEEGVGYEQVLRAVDGLIEGGHDRVYFKRRDVSSAFQSLLQMRRLLRGARADLNELLVERREGDEEQVLLARRKVVGMANGLERAREHARETIGALGKVVNGAEAPGEDAGLRRDGRGSPGKMGDGSR